MANAVRLTSNGVIEVRTGVLSGLGPIGPRGIQGLRGPDGEQGPEGPTGPPGAINQYLSKASISGSTAVGTNTDQMLSFGTVNYDDLSIFQSSTNIVPSEDGDYLIQAWCSFALPANAGDSIRSIWLNSTTNGVLCRTGFVAVADEPTYASVSWVHRAAAGEIIRVYVRHSDDLSVSVTAGAVSVCRVGSGPQGVQGPQGTTGNVGPTGPTGPAGPPGSATSGFPTYADLL